MSRPTRLISAAAAGAIASTLLLGGEAIAITDTLTPPSGITDDSYVESASPGNANGTQEEMRVKRDSSNARMDSLIKINLRQLNSGVLSGLTITSVTLRLFMHDAPGGTGTYGVYRSGNTTWVESSVNFTNFGALPPLNGTDLLASVVPGNTDNVTVDWTSTLFRDHVQAIVNGAAPTGAVPMTLVIRDNSTTADREGKFRTRNHTNTSRHPRLIVTYTVPLTVTKTASPAITQTVTWDIDKSVEPAGLDLFRGDSGTAEYTINVDKSVAEAFGVSGTITITNPTANTAFPATITDVTDMVTGVGAATVSCPGGTSQTLDPGNVLNCTYGPLTLPDNDTRTNTATVMTSGNVAGNQGTASINFSSVMPTVNGFATVSVDDDNAGGDRTGITDDVEYSYNVPYACDADQGTQGNTATITETDQSDGASVTVNCYELQVTKDVETEFTRTWEWTIEKTRLTEQGGQPVGQPDELTLDDTEPYEAYYEVALDATSEDSEHAISGTITVHNPAPIDASITSVTDNVNSASANVTCPGGTSQTLAAASTLECRYEADLDDGTATQNTATVTIQNTPSGTTDFTGMAAVAFNNPSTVVDECVEWDDSLDTGGGLPGGEACVPTPPTPVTFEYSHTIGPFAEQCGNQQVANTASFTSETEASGEATHTVNVSVVGCSTGGDDGCTLSQGYWKTHSSHGPAPYDATWDGLENTKFFEPKNTQTFYQVLWTAPKGNAYYILAHQYIAAQLNELNNANFEDAQTAYDAATVLFGQYTPAQVALLKGNNAVRQQFISYAGALGDYNSGIAGPGHCDEDGTTAP